jgi:hypothetical protein
MDDLTGRADAGLEAAFSELREMERVSAPDIRGLLRAERVEVGPPPRPGPLRRRRAAWVAGAGAAAAAAFMTGLLVRDQARSRRFEESLAVASEEIRLGSWRAPSDFLLNVPGRELYVSLPAIGTEWTSTENPPFDTIPPEGDQRRNP